jgi:hypothetical protein
MTKDSTCRGKRRSASSTPEKQLENISLVPKPVLYQSRGIENYFNILSIAVSAFTLNKSMFLN